MLLLLRLLLRLLLQLPVCCWYCCCCWCCCGSWFAALLLCCGSFAAAGLLLLLLLLLLRLRLLVQKEMASMASSSLEIKDVPKDPEESPMKRITTTIIITMVMTGLMDIATRVAVGMNMEAPFWGGCDRPRASTSGAGYWDHIHGGYYDEYGRYWEEGWGGYYDTDGTRETMTLLCYTSLFSYLTRVAPCRADPRHGLETEEGGQCGGLDDMKSWKDWFEKCGQIRIPPSIIATRRAASEAYWDFDRSLAVAERAVDNALTSARMKGE
eukprot:s3211_g11.t1